MPSPKRKTGVAYTSNLLDRNTKQRRDPRMGVKRLDFACKDCGAAPDDLCVTISEGPSGRGSRPKGSPMPESVHRSRVVQANRARRAAGAQDA